MDARKLSLAAVGFVQAAGLGDRVLAQKTFSDPLCQVTPGGATCADAGCLAQGFSQCENKTGTIDAFRCIPQGQPCKNDADCPGGICRTVAIAVIDGCICVDHNNPVKCAVVHDQEHGGQLCADINCRNTMPGFFCDPVTCNCVSAPAPTQTVPPSTSTTTTVVTTTTTTTIMVVDHLKCYRIKDPNKLKGVVDLTSPQFGVEPGCKVSMTKTFCVPVKKAVTSAFVNGVAITPSPVAGQNLVDDYVCYSVVCKPPFPASAKVQDQFSTRTFTKFKAFEVCVPAHKVP